MKIDGTKSSRDATKACASLASGFIIAIFFMLVHSAEAKQGFCSQTANTLFAACKAGVSDDSLVRKAVCINLADGGERDECFNELEGERQESLELCRDQHDWRLEACNSLGEDRYDPDFDPANFDTDFTNLTKPNPYFPLTIGNQWTYRSRTDNEFNTIQVLNQTKMIDGVTCVVVRDKVFKNGSLVENTDDWYAQALDKNVWYCGEEVKDFEIFNGDNPKRPELVSIDGSFKAGREGDKPGRIFVASPKSGDVYLEEFSLANAEDVTVILSSNYSFGMDPDLDQLVPQQLAERFCSNDCVVTKNFSLLEPGVIARKYYAPGIGVFLEVEFDPDAVIQLVNCNFDSRCQGLPTP
jgi:hypothetical protein